MALSGRYLFMEAQLYCSTPTRFSEFFFFFFYNLIVMQFSIVCFLFLGLDFISLLEWHWLILDILDPL